MERGSQGDERPGLFIGCSGTVGLHRWRKVPVGPCLGTDFQEAWGCVCFPWRPPCCHRDPASGGLWPVSAYVWALQLCPTLCDPMDYSLPGSSVHEILQSRILEWVAMLSSRGSSWPRDWTSISCIAVRFFTQWATWETLTCQTRGWFYKKYKRTTVWAWGWVTNAEEVAHTYCPRGTQRRPQPCLLLGSEMPRLGWTAPLHTHPSLF